MSEREKMAMMMVMMVIWHDTRLGEMCSMYSM